MKSTVFEIGKLYSIRFPINKNYINKPMELLEIYQGKFLEKNSAQKDPYFNKTTICKLLVDKTTLVHANLENLYPYEWNNNINDFKIGELYCLKNVKVATKSNLIKEGIMYLPNIPFQYLKKTPMILISIEEKYTSIPNNNNKYAFCKFLHNNKFYFVSPCDVKT